LRFRRAYISHNRLEWWNGHLATALGQMLEVVECPMARFNQMGHPVEADLTRLIDGGARDDAFYLGSLDQLFLGLGDLDMRTATWTDVLLPANRKSLPCLRLFDVVFATQKDSVPALARAGISRVEWLPFAFDTTLRNEPQAEKVYDVGFVGSLESPATRAERLAVLGRLERRYRTNDYRRAAFGEDMMRVYNQSRIVVNIPVPGGFNMRTFEALASGALLVTKAVGNGQDELFRNGTHLVTYRDPAELIDKIDYYLAHDRERQELACAGRREVLAKHTYRHRAERILDVMTGASRTRAQDRTARVAAYAAFYDYLGRADLLAGVALDRAVHPLTRSRLLVRAVLRGGRVVIDFRKRGGVATAGRLPRDM
jgi:hypothetical protein